MRPTRENFRRILARHQDARGIYKKHGFSFWSPVRRLDRRVRFRAWVGTWWPMGAVLIGRWRYWVFDLLHPRCSESPTCCLDDGHEGPCELVDDETEQ